MVRFLIIASGFNCQRYIEGCFNSLKKQTYKNFSLLWVDDGSTDSTTAYALHNKQGLTAFGVTHGQNLGLVKARHEALKEYMNNYNDFDVIVWLDLDDELMPDALEILAKEYEDSECWLTYGGYINSFGESYSGDQYLLSPDKPARQQDWKFIPLRSFKRELYFKLTEEDLFPKMAKVYPDANVLFCLLEMAGKDHIRPISEVLYNYNCSNPLNVTKRFPEKERYEELKFIKSLTPKEPLKCL